MLSDEQQRTLLLYILSYILCASAHRYDQYYGSDIVYCIGQTSMQILNQLIVADITSSRWHGLTKALVNTPFMVIPWIQPSLPTLLWQQFAGARASVYLQSSSRCTQWP